MKRKGLKLQRLQMLPSETEKEWKTAIREDINTFKSAQRKAARKTARTADFELEINGEIEKRRIKALMDTLPEVSEKHPKAVRDWISLNIVSETYAMLEEDNSILFAAAIWILDQISKTDNQFKELYPILPTSDKDFDDVFFPDVFDSQYEDTLIYSVESVLRHRNRDVAPPEENGNGGIRILTSTLAAKGQVHSDAPSRQTFDKLLALIPSNAIISAIEHFRQHFEEWNDRYFKCIEPLCDEFEAARQRINSIREEINLNNDKAERLMNDRFHQKKPTRPVNSPVLNAPFAAPVSNISFSPLRHDLSSPPKDYLREMIDDEVFQILGKIDELGETHSEAVEAYNDAKAKKFTFQAAMNRRGFLPKEHCEQIFGKAVSNNMEILTITDPYELCFALLYLIELDDNIPWLYGACIGLMSEVVKCLPWGFYHYEEEDDDVWFNPDPEPQKPITIPDWYERKYYYKNSDMEFRSPRNLAQIVYEETGCIMPRDLHLYDGKHKILGKYGIHRNNAVALLYCMDILGNVRNRREALNFNDVYSDFLNGNNRTDIETEQHDEISREDLEKRISAQNTEIQKLKSALYNAEKKAADAQKKLTDEKEEFELERRELADLREILFMKDSSEETESEDTNTDIFPYETKKDTVVFGGHFTWIKVFKPLFKGNIRYVEAGAAFDTILIRNCEVVWIQNNAIPHSQYYKVVNTARQYKKPVRYFKYASAVKCAEQLAIADSEE